MKGLTDLTAPLRELIRKESEFAWNESHTKALRAIHDKLSNAPMLRYWVNTHQSKITQGDKARVDANKY